MPRTVFTPLTVLTSTTAPRRRPGSVGIKVTDWVHLPPTARLAEAQLDEPVATVKSPFAEPSVSTSTLLTVPATVAVTLMP